MVKTNYDSIIEKNIGVSGCRQWFDAKHLQLEYSGSSYKKIFIFLSISIRFHENKMYMSFLFILPFIFDIRDDDMP